MKTVEVWLYRTSDPLVFSALSTYEKGSFYCVHDAVDRKIRKFPIMHIFRIVETAPVHGGQGEVQDWRTKS